MKQTKENWEIEFDKKCDTLSCYGGWSFSGGGINTQEVINFIRNLIQETREETIKECLIKIKNMNLWTKGTSIGTRKDIIFNLENKFGIKI